MKASDLDPFYDFRSTGRISVLILVLIFFFY